ncbi:MAG: hypothetical protein ACOC44_09435 [Promethearchaeia archaeon]
MKLIEEELEMYNSKIRLLTWLYDELELQPRRIREKLKQEGKNLPLSN